MNEVKVINEQIVLGKEFKVYGTVEEPLFLAKDVASWIGHSDVSTMMRVVDEDEKVTNNVCTLGGIQTCLMVTENGLYEILMMSRKPIAKEFKKEVKRILKQIRLTGGTVVEDREEEFINNYFPSFSDDVKLAMVKDLREKNLLLKQTLQKAQPKLDVYDRFMETKFTFTATQMAKLFNISSAMKLNQELNRLKVCYKQGKSWLPYATTHSKWYVIVANEFGSQLRFTSCGVIEIAKLMNIIIDEQQIETMLKEEGEQ